MNMTVNDMVADTTEHAGVQLAGGRKPRILFVIDTLLGIGGAEGALRKIVTHLPQCGFDVSIATFDLLRDPEFLRLFPCTIYDLPMRRTYDWNAVKTAFRLWRLVRRERFDIVHTFFPTADLWAAPLIRLAGRRVLVSGRRDMGILRSVRHRQMYRLLGSLYDQVQTVSEEVRRASIQDDGLNPDRVATVHNGIELESISNTEAARGLVDEFDLDPAGATVITALGMVWPVKGVDVLIRAAAIVTRQFPHTNFIVAGYLPDNGYPEELHKLADSLGVGKNFRFLGRNRNIISIVKACDVYCQLSRSEGMSNALLEAMACGLPCVATRVGGNPEVVAHGESGFLVDNQDSETAAQRIVELLRDRGLRSSMGHAGRKRVGENFTVEVMTHRMTELYRQLLDSRSR